MAKKRHLGTRYKHDRKPTSWRRRDTVLTKMHKRSSTFLQIPANVPITIPAAARACGQMCSNTQINFIAIFLVIKIGTCLFFLSPYFWRYITIIIAIKVITIQCEPIFQKTSALVITRFTPKIPIAIIMR